MITFIGPAANAALAVATFTLYNPPISPDVVASTTAYMTCTFSCAITSRAAYSIASGQRYAVLAILRVGNLAKTFIFLSHSVHHVIEVPVLVFSHPFVNPPASFFQFASFFFADLLFYLNLRLP
jgi:hypothetical protein